MPLSHCKTQKLNRVFRKSLTLRKRLNKKKNKSKKRSRGGVVKTLAVTFKDHENTSNVTSLYMDNGIALSELTTNLQNVLGIKKDVIHIFYNGTSIDENYKLHNALKQYQSNPSKNKFTYKKLRNEGDITFMNAHDLNESVKTSLYIATTTNECFITKDNERIKLTIENLKTYIKNRLSLKSNIMGFSHISKRGTPLDNTSLNNVLKKIKFPIIKYSLV